MLTFNTMLKEEGLDLTKIRLIRHADPKHRLNTFDAWLNKREAFEQYQSTQKPATFAGADHIAAFTVDTEGSTIFVGVYRIDGHGALPPGHVDPLTGAEPEAGHVGYELAPTDHLKEYFGRLVIDWGKGTRAWSQWAGMPKPIIELRRAVQEPSFPGFRRFHAPLAMVPTFPASWRQTLSVATGVYLLTHAKNGQLYVGSATGGGGFFMRWSQHALNPDPVELKTTGVENLMVTILELTDPAWPSETLRTENHWKMVLGSKVAGLNRN